MLINLTDVLTSEGKEERLQVEVGLTDISCRMGDFPIVDKTLLNLTLKNLGMNKASVEGRMELVLAMNCDRCLKEVRQKIVLHFVREAEGPDAYQEKEKDDEQNFMAGYQLDVDGLVKNECLMNLPTKVLCKPDCRGICIKCGKDLNTGECGCDTFVPDPRMAGIKDIFNAAKSGEE